MTIVPCIFLVIFSFWFSRILSPTSDMKDPDPWSTTNFFFGVRCLLLVVGVAILMAMMPTFSISVMAHLTVLITILISSAVIQIMNTWLQDVSQAHPMWSITLPFIETVNTLQAASIMLLAIAPILT